GHAGSLARDPELELRGTEAVATDKEWLRAPVHEPPRRVRVSADVLGKASRATDEGHGSGSYRPAAQMQNKREGSITLSSFCATASHKMTTALPLLKTGSHGLSQGMFRGWERAGRKG